MLIRLTLLEGIVTMDARTQVQCGFFLPNTTFLHAPAKTMSVSLSAVAEDIDRLITLDINRRGVIQVLHEAARKQTGRPLVLAAADTLASCCTARSVVLIASGWPDRPWVTPEIGELDGPPGAALLARSLHRVLGIVPFFLIEKELLPAMHATARSAGFSVLPPDQALSAFDSEAPIHAAGDGTSYRGV
jgi:hypothetical protein